ncbi:dihydrofolate reductase [Chitiniphilus purpureus]|uniref:Dihydrofolate reductase n=1 Tax=Chitiniphilus purpureus TaxID=2981137 RepID=A0ABY6DJ52_9NEIS|nr:dihydrofolate reductase [Chitiniphilus sp. CD1]UXY14380.1 dihydrofolate reductase [Chitiniphilus sp. CD1]
MALALIAAVARNRVIGVDNRLPWRIPDDLKRFKAMTMGHPMIMGRKTFESFPAPLPGRRHLVVTRNPAWQAEGAEVYTRIADAVEAAADATIYVVGGGEIYRQTLPLADTLHLTEVDLAPAGDAWFPEFAPDEWQEVSREAHQQADGIRYAFVTYRRR